MELRSYKSPRRATAALATKGLIFDAALRAFQADGYGKASMSDIAAAAGVSLNTVYTSVGNKPQLLTGLIEGASMSEQIEATLAAIDVEIAPEKIIMLLAQGTRAVFEANEWVLGELYDNAASDPHIASATADADARYRIRISQAAARLDALGKLRSEVSMQRASEILWFYFGFRPWRDLRGLGWSWTDAQDWLAAGAYGAVIGD